MKTDDDHDDARSLPGVRSAAETGCKKPEGVPASVFELGDLCRQSATSGKEST